MSAGAQPTPEQQERIRQAFQAAADARLGPGTAQVVIGEANEAPATDAPLPFPLRRDARRVMTAAELHEAADMAERGDAIPGTAAEAKYRAALADGEFARANEIREAIKTFAPQLRAAAIAAANGDRQRQAMENAKAVVDVQTQERARVKRERKKAKRARRAWGDE